MSLNCSHQCAYCSSLVSYERGQPWWNDTDRGILKVWEKNLSQCHFTHNKSTRTDLGTHPSLCGERPVTNHLNHCTASMNLQSYKGRVQILAHYQSWSNGEHSVQAIHSHSQWMCSWDDSRYHSETHRYTFGHAMTQAVSHWPLTTEAKVHAWVNPGGT
jgi:hypothetical protein